MKLKYKFIIRNIDNHSVAVAVGRDNVAFRGMIKLNDIGKFIFEMLYTDTTEDEIVSRLTNEYDVSDKEAFSVVKEFTDRLKAGGLLED